MKRIVLDTNVTIAALFWNGHPRAIYDLAHYRKFTMLLSRNMEKEFVRVLGYPKFGLSSKQIQPFIKNLRAIAEPLTTKTIITEVTSDPTDNIFLECALDGKADYIISGDKHLLYLGTFSDIKIVKPKQFLLYEGFLKES